MIDDVCGFNKKVGDDVDKDRLGPFRSDQHEWPNLYTEIVDTFQACILVYPLAELRGLVRADKVKDPSVLQLPMTQAKALQLLEQHQQAILETEEEQEFYQQVFDTAKARNMMEDTNVQIVAVDDKFEQQELVYSVHVDEAQKKITVCFRGSVTKTDWATNYEILMKEVTNPFKGRSEQEDTLRVHNGFYDYLLKPSSRGAKGPDGEDLSEYQEILQEHVLPILKQYPDFKLYVTGHSLGAALATLFAFYAAAEPDSIVPKPVSLFSFAGPYVGDESFRSAHLLLESMGKLRHLRVTNHKDVVTLIPKMSFSWNVFSPHVGSLFKHVGLNVRLLDGSAPFEISYPRVRSGYFTATMDELARGWDQSIFANFLWNPVDYWKWPQHSLPEYNKRIDANKPSLETLYLNDLYSREDIVGQLVPQF